MKLITKIWNWIKGLFKRTQFDNVLFAKGVNDLRELLKEELAKVEGMSVDKFYDAIITVAYNKFGKIAVVRKHLETIILFANEKTKDLKTFINGSINKKIDMVCDKMIKWYDENL